MSNLTDHLDGVGRPVAYFPKIARALGGVKQGLLVCQLYYLDGKQRDEDGWIYKTAIEITEETGLSYEEQTTARRELKKKKILEERHDRLDHKMYYRINKEALNAAWQIWVEKEVAPIPEQGKAQFGGEAKPSSGVRQSPVRSIEHRLHTETTTSSCADSTQHATNGHLTPDQLIDLYNEKTPDECPAVRERSPQRKEKAKKYLKFFPERKFWEEVFQQIHHSKFLRGLQRSNGHQRFIADFDWLLTKGQDGTENCVKVHDGKYHD